MYHFTRVQILLLKSASYRIFSDTARTTNVFNLLPMVYPSLMDWLFNKDNPLDNKDKLSDAKMSSIHSDPKTGCFVWTQLTDKPPFHSTTTRTCNKNDDLIMEKAMFWTLVEYGFDKNNPSEDTMVFSFQYNKTGKLVRTLLPLSVYSLHSSTTHTNANITENKTNITPLPPPSSSSHKTDITCTAQFMTSKYVSIGPYGSVSS